MASEFDQTIEHRYKIITEGAESLDKWLSTIGKRVQDIDTVSRGAGAGVGRFLQTFDKLDRATYAVTRLGRGLDDIGQFFGNEMLRQIGRATSGIGQFTNSVGDLIDTAKQLKGLGNITAGLGVGGTLAAGGAIGVAVAGINQIGVEAERLFNTVKGIVNITNATEEERARLAKELADVSKIEDVYQIILKYNTSVEESGKAADQAVLGLTKLTGALVRLTGGYEADAKRPENVQLEQRLAAVQDYQERLTSAELSYQQGRASIYNDANSQALSAQRQYEQQRASLIANFQQQSTQAEEQYYQSRAQLAESFGAEAARMEEDHQRNIRRLIEDSRLRQMDLIAGRDALGLARERRNLEIQRRRAEEDYQVTARRRNEDFARQIAQMEQAFRQQQEERQTNYERQLAELAEQHRREVQEIGQNRATRLRELERQHRDELYTLRRANIDRLLDLGVFLGEESRLRREAQAQILADYYKFLQDMINATPERRHAPGAGQQAGGYANAGDWLHAGEFVLSAQTTRAAEWMVGGRLSQQRLLSALNQSFTFHGGFSDQEKSAMQRMVYDTSVRAIRDVVRA